MKDITKKLELFYKNEPEKMRTYVKLILAVLALFFMIITGIGAFRQKNENIFLYFFRNLVDHYLEFIMLAAALYMISQQLEFIGSFSDSDEKNPKMEQKYAALSGMLKALFVFVALSFGTLITNLIGELDAYNSVSMVFQIIEKGCLLAAVDCSIKFINELKEEKVHAFHDITQKLLDHVEIIVLFTGWMAVFLIRIFSVQAIINTLLS